MTWLLFIDESGHDHKNTPMEVRGGIAIHVEKAWSFINDFQKAEMDCFGISLAQNNIEVKGAKLLDKKRFEWASKYKVLTDVERHAAIRRFIKKPKDQPRKQREFAAYGQASLLMVDTIFDLLDDYNAFIFASCIPKGITKPKDYQFDDYLRKDHVFLQERFFWFLEARQEHGILVMDQTDKSSDRYFIEKLKNYYTKTNNGIKRSQWIFPTPLFVDSSLTIGVQAADVCLYCINWAFRIAKWGVKLEARPELEKYAKRCSERQFKGDMPSDNETYKGYGIIFVPDPYNHQGKSKERR